MSVYRDDIDLIEENKEEIFRYARSLGIEMDDENLIYYDSRLGISKSINGHNWIISSRNGKYQLLHQSSNFSRKMRWHKQYESKSYHLVIKSLSTTHGIEYYKKKP